LVLQAQTLVWVDDRGNILNDFGRDITGLHAVLKSRNHYKHNSSVAERTVKIIGGPGCKPEPEWNRRVKLKFEGGHLEDFSSYDLEFVIDETGKKIKQIEPKPVEADVCPSAAPVATLMVKRKKS